MDVPHRPKHPRVPRQRQIELLSAVIERVSEEADRYPQLVVFDLDGTLLDNRPRSVAIMHELAAKWETDNPEEAELLREADAETLAYLFEDNLRALGVRDSRLLDEALTFWKDRFFTDDFLLHDQPVDGAVKYAVQCWEAGATLVYFTGRDLPNMALGSLASLRDLGFPIGVPGTQLVLKPDAQLGDDEFKRDYMPALRRSGHLVAAFDNEPGNCNIFKSVFPDVESFLVDTQHLPGAPELRPDVHVIEDLSLSG
jgi:hypothetical protein